MNEKKADAWMPLWIGAYLADTLHLTTVQHGAYFLLLIAYWREQAPLPDDDDQLRSITKMERSDWKRARPVVSKFFKVGDGVWWHKRVEAEIASANARSKKASEKAGKAAQARWKEKPSDAPSMPQALLDDVHDDCPTPSPTPLPTGDSEANASGGSPPANKDSDAEKQELYEAGKSLLAERGMAKSQCGSFITKLAKDHGRDIALEAVRAAVAAQPLEAREYLIATCQRLKGERKPTGPPLTVPSDADRKTAAYIAQQSAHAAEAVPPPAAIADLRLKLLSKGIAA